MRRPKRRCPHCGGSGKVDDPYEIGLQLRADRIASGMTLEDVAKRMGVTRAYVSHLERGVRNWTDDLISDFREALK
jgi:transcriptional regulator with XRE-family HTH domain